MTGSGRTSDPLGIVLIHASAVSVDSGALIFLGPSGTGKSTIRRLLSGLAHSLADDMVYLIPRTKGRWTVADAGTRPLNGPLSEQEAASFQGVPLRAIFRLCQASEPHLEPIPALETCRHLTASFFDLYWSQKYGTEKKELAFRNLAEIARSVPGFYFHFDRSSYTLEIINEQVSL